MLTIPFSSCVSLFLGAPATCRDWKVPGCVVLGEKEERQTLGAKPWSSPKLGYFYLHKEVSMLLSVLLAFRLHLLLSFKPLAGILSQPF